MELIWLVPIATAIFGLIIGWLGQRSGFCSIGGIRDLMLFKQKRLILGFVALIVSAFVFYLIFSLIWPDAYGGFFWIINKGFTAIGGAPAGLSVVATVICMCVGGIIVGILGVLLGGCPLRQLVMTGEGNLKAIFFVIGLIIGAIVFTMFISGWVTTFFDFIGL